MSLLTLPKEMYAEIARFLGGDFPGKGFRKAAGTVQIRDYTDSGTYLNGLLHSFDDQPAGIFANGRSVWYQHGKLHRMNDLPSVIYADGTSHWYHHGIMHRDDLPAIIRSDGTRAWYQHGKLHRDNGPAVIYADGQQEYWLHGHRTKRYIK